MSSEIRNSTEIIQLNSSSDDEVCTIIEDVEVISLDECNENCRPSQSKRESLPVERIEDFSEKHLDVEDDCKILLEIPRVIPRINPEINQKVYGQGKSAVCKWDMGVVNGSRYDPVFNMLEYDVKFDIKKIKRVNGEEKLEYRAVFRFLPPNLMAFDYRTPFKLPVGSRVIANVYRHNIKAEAQENFFVGIIAEPLKRINKRYLVFFDDGTAQYTKHSDIRLVYASSGKVWEDVYPDSQQFIEEYLKCYPDVPLMAVTKDSRVTVEWNGKPWIAKVIDDDHSMVNIEFEFSGHTEWIYRGSQRLLKYKPSRLTQNGESNRHFSIEVCKVFGDVERYSNPLWSSSDSCIEYEGKLENLIIPTQDHPNIDTLMSDHECKSSCIKQYEPKEYGQVPALAVPFYLGFTRVVDKSAVYYKGPCGKTFHGNKDLHEFLLKTNSDLGIDHFTFKDTIRCTTKFVPKSIYYRIKDISHGVNIMPVECVNSLGNEMPEYFGYTNEMLPTPGVNMNQDLGFLTCCDCVDDCQDTKNCTCWQLTFSGVAFNTIKAAPLKGYEYRRLYEFVVSGIYECNKGCKCRKTCLNRVIQNEDAKFPLQVFKTSTKGWAIRPLCDIPIGSFICTYGGQVLTESKANEDGKKFGDEYLAAIDHIEVVEHHKYGYESSPDISDIDSDDEHELNTSQSSNLEGVSHMKSSSSWNASILQTPPSGAADCSKKFKRKSKRKSTRQCFDKDEKIYVMDAKSVGNFGRYLNHSCDPNVYVQNVFVDSHDIRFPWVSFFALRNIPAGTELTWNYNYEIDSIPGKLIYCRCGVPGCKGRLL